ncbi:hypothetical protein O6H91_12G103300 [Diphasiastrum complanatum]|uniref:Uncharacterized protein n=2 Tax=Diphasiastrum complanatum TaxID=34168 RepID=A0ACC2C5A0_DIPCM|nr:hypothetical protein O6H91_12G102900 [Diphasiastrum complanatum]KAJ7537218.1 hypothetical protein O6H91_12G103300 [Diphasiastrum complanatum]
MVRKKDRTPGPGAYDTDVRPVTPNIPAYTIAGRTLSLTSEQWSPGPGSYPITSKRSGPAFTMLGKQPSPLDHQDARAASVPGPGAYYSAKLSITHPKDPAYSISGKCRSFVREILPGPGAYALHNEDTGPSFSIMGRRSKSTGRDEIPGPGSYSPDERMPRASPAFSIGNRHGKRAKEENPGPGTYLHGSTTSRGPAYTISRRKPPTETEESPGPGEYYVDVGSPLTCRKEPAYTIGGRCKTARKDSRPGPGAYTLPVDRGPCYSIGGRWHRPKGADPSPGPGTYSLKHESKVGSPAYTIAGRHLKAVPECIPGPGTYDPRDSIGAGPCITFTGRKPAEKVFESPGPSDYNTGISTNVLNASHAISMGIRFRKKAPEEAPGPGAYTASSSTGLGGPAFTMTSGSERFDGF